MEAEYKQTLIGFSVWGLWRAGEASQAVSVRTLEDLVNSHYVITSIPISRDQRSYMCTLTKMGEALAILHRANKRKGNSHISGRANSKEARDALGNFMYIALISSS
jgi:hypothetical protein